MTYWLTIIASLAILVIKIKAEAHTVDTGTISKTISLMESDPSKSRIFTNEENRVNKRASFMPSRGKKQDQFESTDNAEKRRSTGFLPMRGRKDFSSQQLQTEGWYVDRPAYQYQIGTNDKRAGFMPMRGRKSSAYESDSVASDDNSYDVYPMELIDMKRMASFMPMRGRKDDINYDRNFADRQPYSQSIQNIDSTNWMEGQHRLNNRAGLTSISQGPVLEKKANAFFGARGKRSAVEGNGNKIGSKRVDGLSAIDNHHKYNENFFATRG